MRVVTMTSDELRSAEKRAEDALLEKENMNKSMTPREVKAISTTYVSNANTTSTLHSRPAYGKRVQGFLCVWRNSGLITSFSASLAENASSPRSHTHKRKPDPPTNRSQPFASVYSVVTGGNVGGLASWTKGHC